MKEYARAFYKSTAWKKLSALYMTQHHYVCERCGGPASICHHKEYINPNNINDLSVTLNMDNLECLCLECHNKEHHTAKGPGVYNGATFDAEGNLVKAAHAVIVCGAPGSGKSTYVRRNKADDDIVFDMDYICAALMGTDQIHEDHRTVLKVALELREAFYDCVELHKGKWSKAWIITSMSDTAALELLAFRLKAEVYVMPVSLDECVRRITNDPTRTNKLLSIRLARKWYRDRDEQGETGSGAEDFDLDVE